jgi:cell wall-associated NlpC family hydrolase
MNGTVDQVIKHSFLYSYILSQPFAVYVDAYPVLQNTLLLEAEQLQYGHHGQIIRILQKKLDTLAYYEDDIDGDFGILTEYALKKFQSDHHVTITGHTDGQTILALIEAERKSHLDKLKELSESVYPGMHNDDVKIVQEALHYFGYYEGEIDGIYGPLTKKALQIAEAEHGIQLTEEVTQESLAILYEQDHTEEIHEDNKVQKEETTEKEPEQEPEIQIVESEHNYNNSIIEVAHTFIGTPYVWGGQSPGGFDCSGFIQYVYQTQNIVIPRTVSETWNFAQSVESPSVGDLVFFETYKPGPSHIGIYLGDGKFIHAGSSNGVEISELQTSYWEQRYLGAKRIN